MDNDSKMFILGIVGIVVMLCIGVYLLITYDDGRVEECKNACENSNMEFFKSHDGYDGHPDECWCIRNNKSERVY